MKASVVPGRTTPVVDLSTPGSVSKAYLPEDRRLFSAFKVWTNGTIVAIDALKYERSGRSLSVPAR